MACFSDLEQSNSSTPYLRLATSPVVTSPTHSTTAPRTPQEQQTNPIACIPHNSLLPSGWITAPSPHSVASHLTTLFSNNCWLPRPWFCGALKEVLRRLMSRPRHDSSLYRVYPFFFFTIHRPDRRLRRAGSAPGPGAPGTLEKKRVQPCRIHSLRPRRNFLAPSPQDGD